MIEWMKKHTSHGEHPVAHANGCTTMRAWSKSKLGFADWQLRVVRARRDLPQFQTSYQQVARLRGRPVALGGSLKHRFSRWKTLVSARRANKVVPVRTKCRYIFYTRYRQHLQPAIELSFALFSPLFVSHAVHTDLLLYLSSLYFFLSALSLSLFSSFCLFLEACFANCWYVACSQSFSEHFKILCTIEFLLRRQISNTFTIIHS